MDGARSILAEAFQANPDNEAICLAAVKVESETGEFENARTLLEMARAQCNTAQVWMKSAKLERQLGNRKAERDILDEALLQFQDFPKLWLMRAQWEEEIGSTEEARAVYSRGVEYIFPPFSSCLNQDGMLDEY